MGRVFTAEDEQQLWLALRSGMSMSRAARSIGRSPGTAWPIVARTGGVRPPARRRAADRLSLAEREDIAAGVAAGAVVAGDRSRLGRPPSTVSRELARNGGRAQYRPSVADQAAWDRAARPKPCKLAHEPGAARARRRGPEAAVVARADRWLARVEFPDDPELRVSHETIYLSLFVQAKGLLDKELTKELRSGRGVRRAGRISVRGQGRGQIVDALNISERPAEADDRAVPGHWEGDMVVRLGQQPRRDAGRAQQPLRADREAAEQDDRLRHRRAHRAGPGAARAAQAVA